MARNDFINTARSKNNGILASIKDPFIAEKQLATTQAMLVFIPACLTPLFRTFDPSCG